MKYHGFLLLIGSKSNISILYRKNTFVNDKIKTKKIEHSSKWN